MLTLLSLYINFKAYLRYFLTKKALKMFVEFRVSNFRSFKKEVIFSMEPLTQNGKNINIINTGLKKVPQVFRTSGIFGANASGKSNLLKAISYLRFLVKTSSNNNKENKIPDESYSLAGNEYDEPTQMGIQFIVNNKLYDYSFSIRKNIVEKETLRFCPIGKEGSAIFNRVFDRSNKHGQVTFDKSKGILQSWSDETLDNRLFLSEIVNNRKCENTDVLATYHWIINKLHTFDSHKISEGFSFKQISEGNGDNIIELVKNADLGLENIKVKTLSPDELIETIKNKQKEEKFPRAFLDAIINKEAMIFNAKSFHKTEQGSLQEFDFEKMESNGTKNFLAISGPLLEAIKNGEVIIVDELDDSLHPELVKYLISIFNDEEKNQTKSQLIFTSHAHYLMDGEILSRDQIWLISKEQNDGFYSNLYSLSDCKEDRKKKSFYDSYMHGIYGAYPLIRKF